MKIGYLNTTWKQSGKVPNGTLRHLIKKRLGWALQSETTLIVFFRGKWSSESVVHYEFIPDGQIVNSAFLLRSPKNTEENSQPGESSYRRKLEIASRQCAQSHPLHCHRLFTMITGIVTISKNHITVPVWYQQIISNSQKWNPSSKNHGILSAVKQFLRTFRNPPTREPSSCAKGVDA